MKLIPLTQGKFAQVDDEDYEWLSQWKWYALNNKNTFYAVRKTTVSEHGSGKRLVIKMHRAILNMSDNKMECDHKDHNGLNNQRNNIRESTHIQNCYNNSKIKNTSSVYKGVSRKNLTRKYICKRSDNVRVFNYTHFTAQIAHNKTPLYLGAFKTEEEAARAYDTKAKELHGEFAVLNFPN